MAWAGTSALPGHNHAVARSVVRLPSAVQPPFEVYVNGVRQQPGADFRRDGRELVFSRKLAKEGRLGFWRWFLGAWGIGTYRQNDQVDVRYESGGRQLVAHALDIERVGDERG